MTILLCTVALAIGLRLGEHYGIKRCEKHHSTLRAAAIERFVVEFISPDDVDLGAAFGQAISQIAYDRRTELG